MDAYLGLGANLGAPVEGLRQAVRQLHAWPGLSVLQVSRLYSSKPVGPQDQPDYVNAVARLELTSETTAHGLLEACQAVESSMGRTRTVRWGPRVIDIDILLFADHILRSPDLVIPHPELHRRSFVLRPLAELVPKMTVPGLGVTVEALSAAVDTPVLQLLQDGVGFPEASA
ncbi:MAG: 2-amino-4-hydroxy-6-hydroxymethyldihydropteridine diphosphokinase [Myxococcota bacterium]